MNRKKILKFIGIVLIILILLLLIHTIKNYIILSKIMKNMSRYADSNNYHAIFITTDNNNKIETTLNYYKKDNKEVSIVEDDNNKKTSTYKQGERTDTFIETETEKTAYLDFGLPIQAQIYNNSEKESKFGVLLYSITAKIKKTEYNDKKCYNITTINSQDSYVIDENTGLLLKSTNKERTIEREYEFNNVDDSIFIEPDISQFKIKTND